MSMFKVKKRIDVMLENVHKIVTEAKKEGKEYIDYIDVVAKLGISSTYARELLKLYARIHGLTYYRGKLFI